AKIGADGNVIAPETPREILSPALVRNGFTSFQVVVQVPRGTQFELYIAQNPENSVKTTLYRQNGERLEPVSIPSEGDSTQIYWLDVWTDRTAPVQRIKIEPQLHINGDWVIYPMEGRIMNGAVADGKWPTGTALPTEVMHGFLCGTKLSATPPQ